MSNDFRKLLSNFHSVISNGTEQKVPSLESEKTLKELTTSLWQRSQLRQSMKSLKTKPRSTPAVEKKGKRIHLAVCVCIVDSLTHANIWEEWLRNEDNSPVSGDLYVHAKLPEKVTHPWTRSKLIPVSHSPNWNDVRIVRAMLSLMEEALKDGQTTHVIFATESCLPIAPLNEVHLECGFSYMSYYGQQRATRFDERSVWGALCQSIPIDAIRKALPGWCTLAREHAQRILNMPSHDLEGKDLWPAFESCWAPEEAFFPTALALLGLLQETRCKSLTYAEWDTQRTKTQEDKAHPKVWDHEFDSELVATLRASHDCIILRKMKLPLLLSEWSKAVLCQTTNAKRSSQNHNLDESFPPGKKARLHV